MLAFRAFASALSSCASVRRARRAGCGDGGGDLVGGLSAFHEETRKAHRGGEARTRACVARSHALSRRAGFQLVAASSAQGAFALNEVSQWPVSELAASGSARRDGT